jgi:DNA-binding NarL/FixJ family response regulator
LVLNALEDLFSQEADLDVVSRSADGGDALAALRRLHPDIVVLDLRLPKVSGIEVIEAIGREELTTRAVVLATALDENEALECVRLGVPGVVLKDMPPEMLVKCVRKVHAGERWLEKDSIGRALESILRREAALQQITRALTPRETEVARQVAAGLRNKDIAARLCVTEGTVKAHLHNIYTKLELTGRAGLVRYSHQIGLL